VSVAGVVALVGLTLSHEPPEAATLNSRRVLLVTCTVLDPVSVVPLKLKVSRLGVTRRDDVVGVPTVSVTGTICAPAAAPLGVMVIVPW
jgi:hypothetical protein